MRKTLSDYLTNKQCDDTYLLHCDMFPYRVPNEINLGIQEPNMVNVASGLALQGKIVYVYGICGFVIHKSYEQMRLSLKRDDGCVIFVNAGANGCYASNGIGHTINDDFEICERLNIETFEPENAKEFSKLIQRLEKRKGVFWVRLGWDETPR